MKPVGILSFVMRTPKFRTTVLVAATWSVVACAERAGSANDSAAESQSTRADTPSSTAGASPAAWVVGPSGIGPVRVGMRASELSSVAGTVRTVPASDCDYVHPDRLPAGVSVMLVRGEVARVDVDSTGVRTAEGASVGDPASRLEALYTGRATSTPHKYVSGARYVSVRAAAPSDSNRIVFEVENGRVTRYRAGRVPEVEWVERCG